MTATADRLAAELERYGRALERAGVSFDGYQPHLQPPDRWLNDPEVFAWLLQAGRWSGKTDAATQAVTDHVYGPACFDNADIPHRVAIVAPTLDDAREAVVEGPTGLEAKWPGIQRIGGQTGYKRIRWPNGALGYLAWANTPEGPQRLRAGGNKCFAVLEEAAAMIHLGDVLEQADLAVRIGTAKIVIATTPDYTPDYVTLTNRTDVVISHGDTRDNQRAQATPEGRAKIARLVARYENTAVFDREIRGQLVADAPGALWTTAAISPGRLPGHYQLPWPDVAYLAVDPGATNATTGMVLVARLDTCPCPYPAPRPHAVVTQDLTDITAGGWLEPTVDAFRWYASRWPDRVRILYETNYEGTEVRDTIRALDRTIPLVPVRARASKAARARPVRAAYTAGRVHHLGAHPLLEAEMTQWVPPPPGERAAFSPHRLDAMVHGVARALDLGGGGHDGRWLIVRRHREAAAAA